MSATGVIESFTVPAILGGHCYRWDAQKSAACMETLNEGETITGTHLNRGSYPGGYYRVMSPFVSENPVSSVLTIRAANVALSVFVIGGITALMPPRERRVALLTTAGASVPMGWFLAGSVNPSAWAVIGVLGTFLSLHGALASAGWRRAALFGAGVLTAAIAASSRGDAVAYVAAVAGMVLVLHYRTLFTRPLLGLVPFLIGAVCTFIFLSGSSSGYVVQGQELVFAAGAPMRGTIDDPTWGSVLFNNLLQFPNLIFGSFGLEWGIGWLDTRMPAIAQVGALGAFLMLLITGLRDMDRAKLAATLGLATLSMFLPLYILQARLDYVGIFLQPRYLYPLVITVLAFALVDRTGRARLTLGQAAVIYAHIVVAHAAALHSNIRRYVTGQDVFGLDLTDGAEWWWDFGPSPTTLWLIGSVAFALFASAIFLTERPGAEESDSPEPAPSRRAGAAPTTDTVEDLMVAHTETEGG